MISLRVMEEFNVETFEHKDDHRFTFSRKTFDNFKMWKSSTEIISDFFDLLNKYDIDIKNCTFDVMIAGYILNYNVKDDIAYLANTFNYDITLFDNFKKEKNMRNEALADLTVKKAKFIYDIKDEFTNKMKEEEQLELFSNIEMKLFSKKRLPLLYNKELYK